MAVAPVRLPYFPLSSSVSFLLPNPKLNVPIRPEISEQRARVGLLQKKSLLT